MSNLEYIGQLSLESFNQQVIEATIEKCSKTHNPKILEAIKQSWIENLNKRLNSVKTGRNPQKPKLSTSVKEVLQENKEPELVERELLPDRKPQDSEEDEFMDAEVVSAEIQHSPTPGVVPEDSKKDDKSKESQSKPSTSKEEDKTPSEEPDTEISISDISDLDDEEPETNDLVIGMVDKVTRPSSKKFGPPLWKVKLKYGIMQVNNVEIPFDTLEGEFEF